MGAYSGNRQHSIEISDSFKAGKSTLEAPGIATNAAEQECGVADQEFSDNTSRKILS